MANQANACPSDRTPALVGFSKEMVRIAGLMAYTTSIHALNRPGFRVRSVRRARRLADSENLRPRPWRECSPLNAQPLAMVGAT